ncbi:glycosyltransferase family 4 protein [Paenibacillus oleatilyticus]|uniref:Glycosyltransferase family 4 protein n=1 Tax=Paenibacillus oleatilyticus TaxID=2594886 RepID=A0ABV4V7W3_9BACL
MKFLKKIFRFLLNLVHLIKQSSPNIQPQTLDDNYVDWYLKYIYSWPGNFNNQENEPKQKKIKILFLVPWLEVGGADKVNLDLISKLNQDDYEIHLFTTLPSKHPWYNKFSDHVSNIIHLDQLQKIKSISDFTLNYIAENKIKLIQISNTQLGYQLLRTIKKYMPFIKVVDLLHMEEPYYPFDYFRYSKKYHKHIDHRVVITEYLKDVLFKKNNVCAEKITVIPNGIAMGKEYSSLHYVSKNNQRVITVAFVGRMEEQKQPLLFIEIAREIIKQSANAKFVMIGEGSLLSKVNSLISSLDLVEYIKVHDAKTNVMDFLEKEVHILLAPSIREGLPVIGLEAMSLGIPIVATDVPGWSDLIVHNETGFISNKDDLAYYCKLLIDDKFLREKFSRKAYKLAFERYNLDKTVEKYKEIYINQLKN